MGASLLSTLGNSQVLLLPCLQTSMEPKGSETPIILPSEWTPLYLEILSLLTPTPTPILQGAPTPACDSATHRKMLKSRPPPPPRVRSCS